MGIGLLVSFTASAGQDPNSDVTIAPLTARSRAAGGSGSLVGALLGERDFLGDARDFVQTANLAVGDPRELRQAPDEREPQVEIKPGARGFPEVDRSRKGDPVVAMRPSFETRLTRPTSPEILEAPTLDFRIFSQSTALPLPPRHTLPEVDQPLEEADATTQKSNAIASPTQSGSAATPAANDVNSERAAHGATPQVQRAVALSSSTPAQPDALPIEASNFPRSTLVLPGRPLDDKTRPDYAAYISQDHMEKERRCLAEAVYFESRSEPETGQAAVAQVVLNRVSSGLYPSSVCGVVYQNRTHYKACQFSFACEGRSLRVTDQESWATAVRVANAVMNGSTYIADVGRSTHYHANYVRPRWARSLTRMDRIGRHIFYRLKAGQT